MYANKCRNFINRNVMKKGAEKILKYNDLTTEKQHT